MKDQVYGDDITVKGLKEQIRAMEKYLLRDNVSDVMRLAVSKTIQNLKTDVAIMEAEAIQNPNKN